MTAVTDPSRAMKNRLGLLCRIKKAKIGTELGDSARAVAEWQRFLHR